MAITRRGMMFGALGASLLPHMAHAGLLVDGGHAFGSTWRVVLPEGVPLGRIRTRIEQVIREVDDQMSPFRATSALSRFNASQALDWHPVPRALAWVTGEALRMSALTGGAFDPTVGPIVSRHGFGPIKGGRGSYTGIGIQRSSLRKTAPDLTLDLCGIAKGYALDRIIGALSDAGVTDALVEVGGEVRTLGQNPKGRPWRVAIADPDKPRNEAQRIVTPKALALATSGPTVNGVTGPIATSHIIDPHSGKPASTALLSVSVLAPSATMADALATGFCALGPEEGPSLARRLNTSALFVRTTKNGLQETMTGRFAEHVLI